MTRPRAKILLEGDGARCVLYLQGDVTRIFFMSLN